MVIKQAKQEQFQDVRAFYHAVIDGLADMPYGAGWIKDVYPEPEYLKTTIRKGELFIAVDEEENTIVGAMVINHDCNESYHEYQWPTQAEDSEVTVIHALGVLPSRFGTGVSKKMVQYAIEHARRGGQKVVRLDVLKGNVPAEKLYEGAGFRYLHTLPMFYEDTGWTEYELYEYKL